MRRDIFVLLLNESRLRRILILVSIRIVGLLASSMRDG